MTLPHLTDIEQRANATTDVPALTAAIRAVLELHKPKHAIFSWKTGLRYEDPCTTCHGKAGTHECGCWAESDTVHVCEACDQPGRTGRGAWPCPTVRAIAERLDVNP